MMQSSFEIDRPTSATGKAGRSATRGVIALVLAALVAAAASGCSRAHDSAPFPGDNGAPAAKTSSLGQGFKIRLPAGWSVEPFGPGGPDDHGCG
ncbi:MAG: hypothetical protein JWO88_457, partial [Frankiales bacterium]|nr:hypothetical protein [Frankiales bacterium]